MPTSDGPGPRIHYELRGEPHKPVLLMVRGLGRTRLHWSGLVELLEPDFHLVLLDNRGVGRSDVVRIPFTTAEMAEDLLAVLGQLGVARAHVFGTALGGMIAQQLAIAHPGRVDRLVLGCTSPGGRKAARARSSTFVLLASARFRDPAEALHAEARYLLTEGFLARRPDILEQWSAIALAEPTAPISMALQLLASARHDALDELGSITAPTLVVSSDRDELVPPENSRLLARHIPGAEIAWVRGAAHDFSTERPEETARLLRRFLLG